MTSNSKCHLCDKSGLPLLLVRNAVARAQSGAPLVKNVPIRLSPDNAHYTKRLLRSGYVNVFDEARNRWELYFISGEGYLNRVPLLHSADWVASYKPFDCPDDGHRAIAGALVISDPKNATKVWIGFSDVLWTKEMREKNQSHVFRQRHMVEVDIQKCSKGGRVRHSRPIAQLERSVAEYSLSSTKGNAAFSWSVAPFNARYGRAERLISEFDRLRPQRGLLVTVPDPVGIAQDLAALMVQSTGDFMRQDQRDRSVAASSAIDQIEIAIKTQAQYQEIQAAEYLARKQMLESGPWYPFSKSTQKQVEATAHVAAGTAKRAADKAWSKYQSKIEVEERRLWHEQFEREFKAFNTASIAPLAISHVAWMKSEAMADYFIANYDVKSVDSGLVYTAVIERCIRNTQDKKVCRELLEEWLGGDISDPRNLLLRATIQNVDLVADAIKNAAAISEDLRQVPWDNLFAVYTQAAEVNGIAGQSTVASLIVQIAGPLVRMFGKVLDGTRGYRAAIIATGVISGHPVVKCEVAGTQRQLREFLVKQLSNAAGGQYVHKATLRLTVESELKRLHIFHPLDDRRAIVQWFVLADKQRIDAIPDNLSGKGRARFLGTSIRTVDEIEALDFLRWRKVVNQDVCFSAIAAILQIVCLTKTFSDQDKALAHDEWEARAKMRAGVLALTATTAELLSGALAGRVTLGMKFGQGLAVASASSLKTFGRCASLGVGLFMAGLDLNKAYVEFKDNADGLLVVGYIGSAMLGIGISLAVFYAAAIGAAAFPIIGVLVLLYIATAFLIESIKDNPVQEWLERCRWGVFRDRRYPDVETEQAQLKTALS